MFGISSIDNSNPRERLAPKKNRPTKGALALAARLLRNDASQEVLQDILSSSSLCSNLATQFLQLGNVQCHHLALLAVRGAARDARPLAEDHPAIKLCRADLTAEQKGKVLQKLLEMKTSLPVEGSPHGEAHGQHLRFWLSLGSLLTAENAEKAAEVAIEALRSGSLLPATRVLVQNVWAKAIFESEEQVITLVGFLKDVELPEAFATNCLAVAAQLLLHPGKGQPIRGGTMGLHGTQRDLLAAMVGWSTSYVHGPRLLASLTLFHVMEMNPPFLETPGWYLEALQCQVRYASVFKKLRARVKMDEWISGCWSIVKPSRPLDVLVANASKQVAGDFWSPKELEHVPDDRGEPCEGGLQRRPDRQVQGNLEEIDVVVCASLVDNVPNMAGLVRTSEALLGSRVEVALRNDKVLQEATFQKMVVAADKAVRLSSVPCGPRLLAFLREHRCAGRQVIALEQTSSSEMLQVDLCLPKKFVLLLGSEQEGLPAWLLQSGLVDRCIELPLQGRTGSLNVHVAAAMLLWHYRLHH